MHRVTPLSRQQKLRYVAVRHFTDSYVFQACNGSKKFLPRCNGSSYGFPGCSTRKTLPRFLTYQPTLFNVWFLTFKHTGLFQTKMRRYPHHIPVDLDPLVCKCAQVFLLVHTVITPNPFNVVPPCYYHPDANNSGQWLYPPYQPQFHTAPPSISSSRPHRDAPTPTTTHITPVTNIPTDIVSWFSYLDQHEERNKDGITFAPYGSILRAIGLRCLSELTLDYVPLSDLQGWLNINVGTAILIMQYAQEDQEAINLGRYIIP